MASKGDWREGMGMDSTETENVSFSHVTAFIWPAFVLSAILIMIWKYVFVCRVRKICGVGEFPVLLREI